MRGPAFFAYSDNYLIDVKFGVIMDVEASRAIRQAEVGAGKTMVERTEAGTSQPKLPTSTTISAQSGHGLVHCTCPLLGVKRTCRAVMGRR